MSVLSSWSILLASLAYLCLLFAIAYYVDKRADAGRSVIANPYIYALSIAVYCTSWTFYGSVGRAASSGIDFLPIYLGPTLTFVIWWFVLRKIIRISKAQRITSIADFISSRYGKSTQLGVLVTVIAVVGIMPYISLQLKAVSTSFNVLVRYPEVITPVVSGRVPILADTAFLVALLLAAFAILFGTRHIDASEHHEGMVAAIAFESKIAGLLTLGGSGSYGQWMTLTLLSMAAIICLPRQFQVTVVENVNEAHLEKAVWLSLPADHQHLRPADRARRALGLSRRRGGRRHLRADPADERPAGVPGALRVHRRPFRGHRHGHRRRHRPQHHGQQRPGHAGTPAPDLAQADRARRPDGSAAVHSPGQHHPDPAARLYLLPSDRGIRRPGDDRPGVFRRRRAVRPGDHRRHLLEGRHA
jgi:hypothetical protein